MFVRFLMVGAAVALGLDLTPPSGNDLARMAREGQAWCNARLNECVAWCDRLVPEIEVAQPDGRGPAPAPCCSAPGPKDAAAPRPSDPDAAFGAVVDRLVDAFMADPWIRPVTTPEVPPQTTLQPAPTPVAAQQPKVDATPTPVTAQPVADQLDPGLAFELNRQAEGPTSPTCATPAPEPHSCWDLALKLDPEEPAPPAPVAAVPATASRSERLSSAVKLTGQAINAWLGLIRAPAVALQDGAASMSR